MFSDGILNLNYIYNQFQLHNITRYLNKIADIIFRLLTKYREYKIG